MAKNMRGNKLLKSVSIDPKLAALAAAAPYSAKRSFSNVVEIALELYIDQFGVDQKQPQAEAAR